MAEIHENTSVKTPLSSQLDLLAVLDPTTSAEAIALICTMLVHHSLDGLDRQDLQTVVDIIDRVSIKKIRSIDHR
jgi:hypothetical protein